MLGQGQQFVAHGVHPAAVRVGEATPETTPLADLPAVTREQVAAFVEAAERLLRDAGYPIEWGVGRHGPGNNAFAYFIGHASQGFWPVNNGGDAAILYCFVFLYLVFAGPGPWSVDAVRSPAKPRGILGR